MASLYKIFIFLLAIATMSCSKKEIDASDLNKDYFVGTWKISRDISPAPVSSGQVSFGLKKMGQLDLHVAPSSSTSAMYRWHFDAEKKVLTIVSTGEEHFLVIEHTDKTFKARNLATNDPFIFRRI